MPYIDASLPVWCVLAIHELASRTCLEGPLGLGRSTNSIDTVPVGAAVQSRHETCGRRWGHRPSQSRTGELAIVPPAMLASRPRCAQFYVNYWALAYMVRRVPLRPQSDCCNRCSCLDYRRGGEARNRRLHCWKQGRLRAPNQGLWRECVCGRGREGPPLGRL